MSIKIISHSILGDCQNLSAGSATISFTNTYYPVNLTWTAYPTGYSAQQNIFYQNSNTLNYTNLFPGIYSFRLTYSDPSNTIVSLPVKFLITSASTVSLNITKNTTCGLNNAELTGIANLFYLNNAGFDSLLNPISYDYSLFNSEGLLLTKQSNKSVSFENLNQGLYYLTTTDNCGCSSNSNSQIIYSSSTLDFSLYTINTSDCQYNGGKIIVSGLSSNENYNLSWSGPIPNLSGLTLTGLPTGNYSLKVTDSNYCTQTKNTTIAKTPILSFINSKSVSPSCYTSNGSITFYFSGGSAPFYYQLSDGQSQYLLSNQVTFSGLSSNFYTCNVFDVGLCNAKGTANLQTPKSFENITINTQGASCNNLGKISVYLNGGSPPYNFTISGSNYDTTSINTSLTSATFENLPSNTYTLSITDQSNICPYSSQVVVENILSYNVLYSSTGTTCGGANGSIELSVVNLYKTGMSFTYSLNNFISYSTTATTYNFSNLESGIYDITVTDNEFCTKTVSVNVESSVGTNVILQSIDAFGNTDNGMINAYVYSTDGPFSINWSENANGQTGIFLTGLTAGTYTMTLSSQTGCQSTRSAQVSRINNILTASSFSVTYSNAVPKTFTPSKLTLSNMFLSGFSSLIQISGGSNCILSSSTFYANVYIGGTQYEFPFYFTNSITDIPNLYDLKSVIENSILSIPNIASCTLDPENITLNIVAAADSSGQYYTDEEISLSIKINYIIMCMSLNNLNP